MESPFQFKLREPQKNSTDKDVLEEFMRQQIESLLDIVVLTSNGEPIEVDGFIWLKDAYKTTLEEQTKPYIIKSNQE